jgi:hypothetical protein
VIEWDGDRVRGVRGQREEQGGKEDDTVRGRESERKEPNSNRREDQVPRMDDCRRGRADTVEHYNVNFVDHRC